MKILYRKEVSNLLEFFNLFSDDLKALHGAKEAYPTIAKVKTSLIRYTLPDYGFPIKLEGNLTPAETAEGLKFMEQIPIYQVAYLPDAQERVFVKFGDHASSDTQRVYRSALIKLLKWGRSQEWWEQCVETIPNGRTPSMIAPKKRVEHWHKLKRTELPPELSRELDELCVYLSTARPPHLKNLKESSYTRYYREILGILGWMHRVKNIPLLELSLNKLVPPSSIYDPEAAHDVVLLVQEYMEWMRANIGGKPGTLKFPLQTFLYIAEYAHYAHTQGA